MIFIAQLNFVSYYFKDMRNIINIQGYNQNFKYMVEYVNSNTEIDIENTADIKYFVRGNNVYLHTDDDVYFRNGNEWYAGHTEDCVKTYIPTKFNTSLMRMYFPCHSADNYRSGLKYMLTVNTWVGGHKIELGSYLFHRIDCTAIESGVFEYGMERYYDCVEFDIIDPYDIIYSEEWRNFRQSVCDVDMENNNTGSILTATLYLVSEGEDGVLMMNDECIGGIASFNISKDSTGYLTLNLEPDLDDLGWKLTTIVPKAFCTDTQENNRLIRYINNTYGIPVASVNDIKYEIIAKNHDTIVQGPIRPFNPKPLNEATEHLTQTIGWNWVLNEPDMCTVEDDGTVKRIPNSRCGLRHFFEAWTPQVDGWPHFEEGWVMQASMTVTLDEHEMYILSNEVPITQEVFRFFVGWTPDELEKREKIEDMEIKNYTLVNKIENKVIQLDRPDKSKSNIIQPVFFRVNDAELLTIHPAVTENVCVNLDDFKSKVDTFYLQLENCRFNQIGANQYGIIFKVVGASLPNETPEGTYYILNEDYELVTTGKYKYVK